MAEFVAGTGGTNTGLAYQIPQAGYQLNIARMFAALVLITVVGVLLFALMSVLTKWALGGTTVADHRYHYYPGMPFDASAAVFSTVRPATKLPTWPAKRMPRG